jgi:hypothetical protein
MEQIRICHHLREVLLNFTDNTEILMMVLFAGLDNAYYVPMPTIVSYATSTAIPAAIFGLQMDFTTVCFL